VLLRIILKLGVFQHPVGAPFNKSTWPTALADFTMQPRQDTTLFYLRIGGTPHFFRLFWKIAGENPRAQ
jgi:hypothetical protein